MLKVEVEVPHFYDGLNRVGEELLVGDLKRYSTTPQSTWNREIAEGKAFNGDGDAVGLQH